MVRGAHLPSLQGRKELEQWHHNIEIPLSDTAARKLRIKHANLYSGVGRVFDTGNSIPRKRSLHHDHHN
jgi:hypothetical protein